jgi:hypothetical protein
VRRRPACCRRCRPSSGAGAGERGQAGRLAGGSAPALSWRARCSARTSAGMQRWLGASCLLLCAGVHAARPARAAGPSWLASSFHCSSCTSLTPRSCPARHMMLGDVFAVSVPSASAMAAAGPFSSPADSSGPCGESSATLYFRVVDLQPEAPACLLIDPLTTQVALQVGGTTAGTAAGQRRQVASCSHASLPCAPCRPQQERDCVCIDAAPLVPSQCLVAQWYQRMALACCCQPELVGLLRAGWPLPLPEACGT